MAASRFTTSLSRQVCRVQELCNETKRIEETLCSTKYVRSDLIDSIASVLKEIEYQSQHIEQTIQMHELYPVRTLIKEAILQVESHVGETKDALMFALGHRATASSYDEIKIRLCFLSIALDELQNALGSIDSDSVKKACLGDLLGELSKMDLGALTILQSMN